MKAVSQFLTGVITCSVLARLFAGAPGEIDPTFEATVSDDYDHIQPLSDGVVVGGFGNPLEKFDLTGARDDSFTPAIEGFFTVFALSEDRSGRLLVGGESGSTGSNVLYRLLSSGAADPEFTTTRGNGRVKAILELPDSDLLIGGHFTELNGTPRPGIARLNSDGQIDAGFTPTVGSWYGSVALATDGDYFASGNGVLPRFGPDGASKEWFEYGDSISFFAHDLLSTPDGGLWVGEAFSSAQIMADAGVDLSYTNEIWPESGAAAIQSDGRVLLAGTVSKPSFDWRFVRLFADGSEDTNFLAWSGRKVTALALGPNGTAYVSGTVQTNFQSFLARVHLRDPSAAPTIQFNRKFAAVGEGNSIRLTLLRDGDAMGNASVAYSTIPGSAAPETDFTATSGRVAFEPGERSKTISIATSSGPEVRANREFQVELSEPEGTSLGANRQAVVAILDRQSVVFSTRAGRSFSEIEGETQLYVSRNGSLAYPAPVHWKIEPHDPLNPDVFTALQGETHFPALEAKAFINLRVLDDAVVGTNKLFTMTFSSPDPNLATTRSNDVLITIVENDRLNDPGRGVDGEITAAEFYPDGRLAIAGNFSSVNGTSQPKLARLLPSGEMDATFVPPAFGGPSVTISGLVPLANGKLAVLGSFTNVAGLNRKYLARLNQDGSLDETFDAASSFARQPLAVAATPDGGLLALGLGTDFNGVSVFTNEFRQVLKTNLGAVVRLHESGAKDTNFVTAVGVNSSGFISALDDGRFVVTGDLHVYQEPPRTARPYGSPVRSYLARFHPDGRWDTNFNAVLSGVQPTSSTSPSIRSLSVAPDGAVLVTGNFSSANGVPVKSMVRLNTDGSVNQLFTTNAAKNIHGTDLFHNGVLTADGGALLTSSDRRGRDLFSYRVHADGSRDSAWASVFGFGFGVRDLFWAASPQGMAVLANPPSFSRLAWFYPDGTRASNSALGMGQPELRSDAEFQVRVEVRTTGTLVLEQTSDLTTWKEVLRQPATPGLQTITIPEPVGLENGFFRAIVF